ncbi:HEAT repeat domain-containing protein [Massilia sp. TWP1-3-3]|uniref:HEAT repeat domain-containing protein n=1 Tax=Massilia sp. TWP1-3-3 TaxID=2804573 RepID=UPI003CF16A59
MRHDFLQRLASPDSTVRRIAVLELADNGFADDAPLLIAALGDSAPDVRVEAARALEGYDEPDAINALLAALRDNDVVVAAAAAHSLSELKNGAAAAQLLPHAADADPFVCVAVLRALRELRAPGSFAPAMAALQASDALVRRQAVSVLAT